jgi:hypothetical protein
MKINLLDILIWFILPILNFLICFHIGKNQEIKQACDSLNDLIKESLKELQAEIECEIKQTRECIPSLDYSKGSIALEVVDTLEFDKYRNIQLGSLWNYNNFKF